MDHLASPLDLVEKYLRECGIDRHNGHEVYLVNGSPIEQKIVQQRFKVQEATLALGTTAISGGESIMNVRMMLSSP